MEILQFFQKYQARMDALPPGITGKDHLLYMMCAPFLHDLANTQEGEGYSAAHITRCLQLAERRYTSDPAGRAKGANRRELLAYQRGLWRELSRDVQSLLAYTQAHPGEARRETLLAWKLGERLLADKEAQRITASHQGFCYLLSYPAPGRCMCIVRRIGGGEATSMVCADVEAVIEAAAGRGFDLTTISLNCWRSAPATSVCGPPG